MASQRTKRKVKNSMGKKGSTVHVAVSSLQESGV